MSPELITAVIAGLSCLIGVLIAAIAGNSKTVKDLAINVDKQTQERMGCLEDKLLLEIDKRILQSQLKDKRP